MIIDLLASPWRRINPLVRSLLQGHEECDFKPVIRIQEEDVFRQWLGLNFLAYFAGLL